MFTEDDNSGHFEPTDEDAAWWAAHAASSLGNPASDDVFRIARIHEVIIHVDYLGYWSASFRTAGGANATTLYSYTLFDDPSTRSFIASLRDAGYQVTNASKYPI